jgi:integrase
MSVFKRKTTAGESKYYHYRFMLSGSKYIGVCKGYTTKADALKYESNIRKKAIELSQQKTVKALIENFRDDMTGGSAISLNEAFEQSLKKPRKRQPSTELIKIKRSYWRDFIDYMKAKHPEIIKLADIRKSHAEEYIQFIRENGRFCKEILIKIRNKKSSFIRKGRLSNKTCNTFQQTLSEVFDKLFDDAGLIDNPFSSIPKLDNDSESREAFTEEELKLIKDNVDDFVKPIFCIGIATALREGDICTLRWTDVDLKTNVIRRKMLKTRRTVEIPILPPLRTFFIECKEKSVESEYVLPEHANMYMTNSTGISRRVKKFLESLNIKTQKKVEGRDRAISIKDVHSLRHTFCYYAGVYGIPFLVVKDIVGHVSPQMTELYQKHADNRLKREKLLQMPDFMGLTDCHASLTVNPNIMQVKALLIDLINNSQQIDKINQCIQIMEK